MWRDHLTEIIVTSVLFLTVSVIGFVAARWRRPDNLAHLDEWGLGGRSFSLPPTAAQLRSSGTKAIPPM